MHIIISEYHCFDNTSPILQPCEAYFYVYIGGDWHVLL